MALHMSIKSISTYIVLDSLRVIATMVMPCIYKDKAVNLPFLTKRKAWHFQLFSDLHGDIRSRYLPIMLTHIYLNSYVITRF